MSLLLIMILIINKDMGCEQCAKITSESLAIRVENCGCGTVKLHLGPVVLRLNEEAFAELKAHLTKDKEETNVSLEHFDWTRLLRPEGLAV